MYRKWRPQRFSELIGQKHVTSTLGSALRSGRIAHAYLFCGPRGTGKTSTARILAKAINCVNGPTDEPCNECEPCVSISAGRALDVIEIDAASNRKIDEIRELLEKIPFAPTALRTKVYIIDEVHQLTPEASSALLKTLEEPPRHVVFVLATTEPHKILPTIISRCQRFDFQLVSAQEIAELLSRIAGVEGIRVESEAIDLIAEHAHGSVRDALGVMDQISSFSGEEVCASVVAELLGEVETRVVIKMLDLIADRDTAGAISLVGRVLESGKDPRRFAESLISHLRSIFLIQNSANPEEIVQATREHYERLCAKAKRFKPYEVLRLIERFGDAHREMRWSENARLVLECAVVKATRIDTDVTVEGLLYRMDELERKIEAIAGGSLPVARKSSKTKGIEAVGRIEPPVEMAEEKQSGVLQSNELKEKGKSPGGAQGMKISVSGVLITREEARRAWSAVLAELKKEGRVRLFALLSRARIADVQDDSFSLEFAGGASFAMEVLKDSQEVRIVERIVRKVLGEGACLKIVDTVDKVVTPKKSAPGKKKVTIEKLINGKTERGLRGLESKNEGEVREKEEKSQGEQKAGSAQVVARLIKEDFDGEIIEEKGD